MSFTQGITLPAILIDGQRLDDAFEVAAIDITREVNRIPTAIITIGGGGNQASRTTLLGGGPFSPAGEVQIRFHQGNSNVRVFSGVVTGISVRAVNGAPELEIIVKDKGVKLNGPRKTRVFKQETDGGAIRNILSASGLSAGTLPGGTTKHATLVQYAAGDWDFIVTRADALGYGVILDDGKLSLQALAVKGAANRSFSLELSELQDFAFDLNVADQRASISGMAWDPRGLKPSQSSSATPVTLAQGGSDLSSKSDALSVGAETLSHMTPMPTSELKEWAGARQARDRLSLVRGRISVSGVADLKLMEIAALAGLGKRFSGKALVTGLRHRLDARGFSTDIQFGLPPEPFARAPNLADMAARGLLPPASGLQVGVVASTEADPDGEARVQVRVAAVTSDPPQTLWARIATPDAGNKAGICFFPEVNDEVVVGFLDDDPRYPIILGRLHGSKNKPPDGFTDAKQKGIVTHSGGITIKMTEADKAAITILTKGGRKLEMTDDGEAITVSDSSGNNITMDKNGVTIKSAGSLQMEAKGEVKVKGQTVTLN